MEKLNEHRMVFLNCLLEERSRIIKMLTPNFLGSDIDYNLVITTTHELKNNEGIALKDRAYSQQMVTSILRHLEATVANLDEQIESYGFDATTLPKINKLDVQLRIKNMQETSY